MRVFILMVILLQFIITFCYKTVYSTALRMFSFFKFSSDGVPSNSDTALKMVEKIFSLSNAEFSGIYTHYGASYHCHGAEEIKNSSAAAWGRLIDLANR